MTRSLVRAVAVGQVGDQMVAVTGGGDGTVALWRVGQDRLALASGPQPGHRGVLGVRTVAVGQVGDQMVAVTGGDDGATQLWRQRSGRLVSLPSDLIPVGSPLVAVALLPAGKALAWCLDGVLTAAISPQRA